MDSIDKRLMENYSNLNEESENGEVDKRSTKWESIRISIEEAIKQESEYYQLKKAYPHSSEFSDIEKNSGNIRDLTDELEDKNIDYRIYKDKTDNGCTVFYN